MKHFSLTLPYFKQGDDLALFLQDAEKEGEPQHEALYNHADMLRVTAEVLDALAEVLAEEKDSSYTIDAGCHCIWLDCEDALADKLLKDEAVKSYLFLDEMEEFEKGLDEEDTEVPTTEPIV